MEVEAIAKIVEVLEGPDIVYHDNFFSFEGGEGSGKSTVLKMVGEKLAADGVKVLLTREPGGTGSAKAEAIRELIYYDEMSEMEPLTAAFLYAAARTQHVQEVVGPHLSEGYVVLTDRYVDSSLVYQGMIEGQLQKVTTMNAMAIMQTMPATTLFFDVPAAVGLERVFSQRSQDTNYLDHRDMSFHEAVYQGYQSLATIFSKRYVRIDATAELSAVVDAVYQTIKDRLAK